MFGCPFSFFFSLERLENSPGGSFATDGVLVGDREEVALFDGEIGSELDNLFHVVEHVLVSLGLFGYLGDVDQFFFGAHSTIK